METRDQFTFWVLFLHHCCAHQTPQHSKLKVQMQILKLRRPKIPGRNEMRGKLMANCSLLNVFSLKMLFFQKKNNNLTLSPSPFSLSIPLLCVPLTFSYTPYPPLSFPLSVSLIGRCWQQFSQSGPIWQPGQGPGPYQERHWYKYSQSGERDAHSPEWNWWKVITCDWKTHQPVNHSFYSHIQFLLICKNNLQLCSCITEIETEVWSILLPTIESCQDLVFFLTICQSE